MLRDIKWIGRFLRHGRSISVLHQHSDLTSGRLGALRHLVNERFLGNYGASNRRIDGLRECQRRSRDSHLRFHDPDLRPTGYTLPSRSYIAEYAAKSPEKQRLEERFQGARTATGPRTRPSSSLRVQVKIKAYSRVKRRKKEKKYICILKGIIVIQICRTHQCGVHLHDFRTIYHKLDSALSQHLQNVDEEPAELRVRLEPVVSRLHAHADLFVLLVR